MATTAGVLRGVRTKSRQGQVRLGAREDTITIALGFWLLAGLFIDGWAHNTGTRVETFFTPWHAALYSGYAASALWLCGLVWWQLRAGKVGLAAIPRGYELGLVGAALFGLGGIGDMTWHLILGIEVGIEALLSPTHLLLFAGIVLIFSSPLRSAWSATEPGSRTPTLRAFLPALFSLIATISACTFLGGYFWALLDYYHLTFRIRSYFGQSLRMSQELGIEGILLTNVLLIAPLLYALRRWLLPFGSVTILFTVNTFLMTGFDNFEKRTTILAALAAGLIADGLVRWLRPTPDRVGALRLFATLVPLAFWSLYFIEEQLAWGIGWSPNLWAGAIVLSAFSGLGLSLLVAPPAVPEGV
ncbi:MAG: hypothetical protein U0841_32015 [Chloroflexia bacterium]